jgi:hypothetical protein
MIGSQDGHRVLINPPKIPSARSMEFIAWCKNRLNSNYDPGQPTPLIIESSGPGKFIVSWDSYVTKSDASERRYSYGPFYDGDPRFNLLGGWQFNFDIRPMQFRVQFP